VGCAALEEAKRHAEGLWPLDSSSRKAEKQASQAAIPDSELCFPAPDRILLGVELEP